MGRRIGELLLLVSVLAGVAGTASADADGPDYWMVRDVRPTSSLAVRTQPRRDAPKIGSLPYDARGIENLGCTGESSLEAWSAMSESQRLAAAMARWCNVRHQGMEGWVSGRYITEDTGS